MPAVHKYCLPKRRNFKFRVSAYLQTNAFLTVSSSIVNWIQQPSSTVKKKRHDPVGASLANPPQPLTILSPTYTPQDHHLLPARTSLLLLFDLQGKSKKTSFLPQESPRISIMTMAIMGSSAALVICTAIFLAGRLQRVQGHLYLMTPVSRNLWGTTAFNEP